MADYNRYDLEDFTPGEQNLLLSIQFDWRLATDSDLRGESYTKHSWGAVKNMCLVMRFYGIYSEQMELAETAKFLCEIAIIREHLV